MHMVLALGIILLLGCIPVEEPEGQANIIENEQDAENEEMAEQKANEEPVLASETVLPGPEVFEFSKTINGSYVVYFFHSERCSACQESYPIMNELQGKYPGIIFINYSLAKGSGSKAYAEFAELNNLSKDKRLVPQVYVNGTIITDRFNIEEKLGPLLSELE